MYSSCFFAEEGFPRHGHPLRSFFGGIRIYTKDTPSRRSRFFFSFFEHPYGAWIGKSRGTSSVRLCANGHSPRERAAEQPRDRMSFGTLLRCLAAKSLAGRIFRLFERARCNEFLTRSLEPRLTRASSVNRLERCLQAAVSNAGCKEDVSGLVSSLISTARDLVANVYKTRCRFKCSSAWATSAPGLLPLLLLVAAVALDGRL
ncbi:hypothetical protein HPB48_008830 [Haemaphysalis longicornis]|uniref:Uncharacterized protein n=1 Tax=Haemaphysalis longicornis TaxID=44386 RepID=A0A9J6FXK5_HAELO|nr:hypothetical protein HPB48_008830 [Haemaphysalis longicornis]